MKKSSRGLIALINGVALASLMACSSTPSERHPSQVRDEQHDDEYRDGGQELGGDDDVSGSLEGVSGDRRNRGQQPGQQPGQQDRRDGGRRDGGQQPTQQPTQQPPQQPTQQPTQQPPQQPTQQPGPQDRRDDDRREDRREDRRDDRREEWRDDRREEWRDDRRDGRGWRTRGDNRRCLRCFDRSRFNDTVDLGREIPLFTDQTRFNRNAPHLSRNQNNFRAVCGIRSVSIEVLDNEARILGLEVHYAGDGVFSWDTIPVTRDWDFRNGTEEGEQSHWFDVGSHRRNDTACIDGVRVTGYTYKDNFRDFENAKVQVYGSRSMRGVDARRPGPGPGPGPGPRPGPRYEPFEQACFFEDDGYRGRSFCVNVGEDVLNFVDRSFNDRTSSARIPRGWVVDAYRDAYYGGMSIELSGEIPSITVPFSRAWNDQISSIRFRRR